MRTFVSRQDIILAYGPDAARAVNRKTIKKRGRTSNASPIYFFDEVVELLGLPPEPLATYDDMENPFG